MLAVLNDDVLLCLIDALLTLRPQPFRNALYSFSAVSRRLRALCTPILFRRCQFIYNRSRGDQEQSHHDAAFRISHHIEYLRISINVPPVPAVYETLQALLPQLHRLRALYLSACEPGLSLDLVKALVSPPNLQDLNLQNIIWDSDPPYDPLVAPLLGALKRYSERRQDRNVFSAAEPLPIGLDLHTPAFRCDLLWQAQSTIEFIQIPIHHYHLGLLSTVTWTAMRELVLYGMYPKAAPPPLSIVQAMPNLHSLQLLSWSSSNHERIVMCPREMLSTAQLPPLRSITVGDVSLADPFFALLSGDIVSLGIRDVPRYYMTPDYFGCKPPSVEQLMSFFGTRRFLLLEHLEIAFTTLNVTGNESDMYASMVQACPHVSSLVIHRYNLSEPNASLDNTLAALKPLKHLRELRLNLDWPDIPDRLDVMIRYPGSDYDLKLRKKMEQIVSALPHLDAVAVIDHRHGDSSWAKLQVRKDEKDVPVLEGRPQLCLDYFFNGIPAADSFAIGWEQPDTIMV